MHSFAGLIRRTPPPTFSETAITDRHSDTTIFQLRAYLVRISWSIGSEKSFGLVPRWKSNPRLPACKASTLSTRPGSPLARQKAPNFSAFQWSPHGSLITIGQHFVTTRVVHLPKRTETSLITESDQSRANHQLLQLCTVRTAWSDSDQAVRAVHSCNSWFVLITFLTFG